MLLTVVLAGLAVWRFSPLSELLTEERLRAWIVDLRGVWWAPLALIGLYAVLAPLGLPVGPLLVGGAVFGPLHGTLYNTLGLVLGATLSFHLAERLGRDLIRQLAGPRLRRAERMFERDGFWPLVQTRFMPLPFPVVNFGAALAGVRAPRFLLAALVGLIPSTVVHTYFIAKLLSAPMADRWILLGGYAAVFVVFNLLIAVPWLRRRSRRRDRFRDLRQRRAGRLRAEVGAPGSPQLEA